MSSNFKPMPESMAKHKKRVEGWKADKAAAEKKTEEAHKKKEKVIFQKAKDYLAQYQAQETETIKLKREARLNEGFYVEPEAKLVFVMRIKGMMKMHPKSRTIMKILRLRQLFTGVFMKVNKATMNMLRLVEPYIAYGYPNLKSVKELIYKRGFGKVNKCRIGLNNDIIEGALGKHNIVCVEDLVHEIYTVGPAFKQANNFLWPFKLRAPRGGISRKRKHYIEGGQFGNREDLINRLIRRMN
ncbi:hypothetical protein BSKO_07278 [Bryopsis sp. KO-2023]|nr:hypothetical protein BSKO_07278 [Bryopsis sp. KO-2023]